MCGVAGYLNTNGAPASITTIRNMTSAISHRGPDNEGTYVDGSFALGHRRLSIIDLSTAGNQPMVTNDGRYVISYNGEIYNYQELRMTLRSLGVRLVSDTDTEVLLNYIAIKGVNGLKDLNGMFAFAIWDTVAKKLLLARDRYGIKPLYIAQVNNTFFFGSEVKAFFPHPEFKIDIDKQGLVEYFAFQNYFSSSTMFKGVETLPAGHYQWVDFNHNKAIINRAKEYWDYNFTSTNSIKDKKEYLEELDRLFVQAVKRQLISDVEVGSYLSGGMDSGSITAVASQDIDNLKTFTVGFDMHSASGLELAFDEREQAEFMSYHFGTEHYEMVLKAGDMERCINKLVWHLEEPRIGQSYPNFYAANLASRFGKVVLAGAGGDELFGGYPWRYYRAVVNNDFEHYVSKYFDYWKRMVPDNKMKMLFAPISNDFSNIDLRQIFKSVFHSHAENLSTPEDYVNHSLYFEAKTFLHGLFIVEDKLSMGHGLESRVPFMDNDLVDFAMSVPVDYKLGNLNEIITLDENEPGPKSQKYFQRTDDGKLILREAMQKYIPESITTNIKQGFSAPDASWFKGESIDYVKNKLMGENAKIYDYLDRGTVHALVGEHLDGRENRRLLVWSLLAVEQWIDTFIDRNGSIDIVTE